MLQGSSGGRSMRQRRRSAISRAPDSVQRVMDAGLLSDDALVGGMAVGDQDACLAFVRRHQPGVFGLASRMLGERALAEDVAQMAFTKAWQNAASFDSRRASAVTWLYTITRNLAIDELRRRRPEPVPAEDLVQLGSDRFEVGPSDRLAGREDLRVVAAALEALPGPQRRALLLATWYGCTAQEVAELEQIPLGTAKTRIRTALVRL